MSSDPISSAFQSWLNSLHPAICVISTDGALLFGNLSWSEFLNVIFISPCTITLTYRAYM